MTDVNQGKSGPGHRARVTNEGATVDWHKAANRTVSPSVNRLRTGDFRARTDHIATTSRRS
jgi:hypothetical protein